MFHMTLNVPFQFLHHHGYYVFHLNSQYDLCTSCLFFCFFVFQSINRLTDWFTSNEVFYQSDCELVTFDTVELFFLRKENIYLYIEQGGRTSHCLSYCHSQEQSCINKNVLKSVISLSPGMFTGWMFFVKENAKVLLGAATIFGGHFTKGKSSSQVVEKCLTGIEMMHTKRKGKAVWEW